MSEELTAGQLFLYHDRLWLQCPHAIEYHKKMRISLEAAGQNRSNEAIWQSLI